MPEHFNLPWLDALERSAAQRGGFRWLPQPQGTGAMVAALRSGDLDVALLLTEGAVAAVAAGAAIDILASYVETPLQWGIHVPADSDIESEAAIQGLRYAISRRGSGSHLMAVAHARAAGWPVAALEFVVVGTLEGALEAFDERRAEVFFWERFMTAPLVEAGRFRRVGVFQAPWPAFVLCVSRRLDAASRDRVMQLFEDVLGAAREFVRDADRSAARVAAAFGIEIDAAAEWLAQTRWAERADIDSAALGRAANVLHDAGLIREIPHF